MPNPRQPVPYLGFHENTGYQTQQTVVVDLNDGRTVKLLVFDKRLCCIEYTIPYMQVRARQFGLRPTERYKIHIVLFVSDSTRLAFPATQFEREARPAYGQKGLELIRRLMATVQPSESPLLTLAMSRIDSTLSSA